MFEEKCTRSLPTGLARRPPNTFAPHIETLSSADINSLTSPRRSIRDCHQQNVRPSEATTSRRRTPFAIPPRKRRTGRGFGSASLSTTVARMNNSTSMPTDAAYSRSFGSVSSGTCSRTFIFRRSFYEQYHDATTRGRGHAILIRASGDDALAVGRHFHAFFTRSR